MSYLALARKWRPKTFSQLVGQEHISKPLINALQNNRLHHAYLFTGTRGVGKTSVARILAKAFNCEQGINADPCLKCDACIAIEQNRFLDLIEIDGASKTKVEDTRELLDNVQYAPSHGRFKIYLIDEVHMLSQHSFNALLKTLEEPPAHVKFILATTDPQKVPITVLSRCLQFNLKHLSEEQIAKHLQFILTEEQQPFEENALSVLAYAAQGSMRDALSLLDQAITSAGDTLRASDVKTILGYTQQDYALQILQALIQQDAATLYHLSQQILAEGGHFYYVLDALLHYLHQICLCQHLGNHNPILRFPDLLTQLSAQCAPEDIQLFYQIALKGREEIGLAPTLMIGFSMTLFRMLTFRPATPGETPQLSEPFSSPKPKADQPAETITTVASGHLKPIEAATTTITPEKQIVSPTPLAITTAPLAQKPDLALTNWSQIITQLQLTGLALNAIENAQWVTKEDRTVILGVAKGHVSLFTPGVINKIEAGLSQYFNETIKIQLNPENQIHDSPAQQKEKSSMEKLQKATQALAEDERFQQLQKDFSAELVKNSIVPLKDDI